DSKSNTRERGRPAGSGFSKVLEGPVLAGAPSRCGDYHGQRVPGVTLGAGFCRLTFNLENTTMGLLDYLKTQLLEIIQWQDDSRDTISWRFPDEDKEIKRGAQLIVRESQTAQFIYLGQFGDTFGPGN